MSRLAACEHCGEDVWYDHRADQWNHNEDDGDHEARPDEYDETLAERDGFNEAADAARDAFELKRGQKAGVMNSKVAAINFVASQNTTDRQELLFRAHRHASDLTGQLPVPMAQRLVQQFVAAVSREFVAYAICEGCGRPTSEDREAGGQQPLCDNCIDERSRANLDREHAIDDHVDRMVQDNLDDDLRRWGHVHTAGCGCGEDKDCEDCGAGAGEKCRPWCTGEAAHNDEKKTKKESRRTAGIADFPDELMY